MKKLKLSVLVIVLYASSAHAGQTGFYFKSDPGDPIGNGNEGFYTDTQQTISVDPLFGPDTWPNTVDAQIYWSNEYTGGTIFPSGGTVFEFAAPSGTQLLAGTYPYAPVRSDLQSCGEVTGSFEVKEAEYDANRLTRFAVDFVQQCAGSAGAYHGYLRYNSDVPFPDVLPPSIAADRPLNDDGCFEATGPEGADVPFHVVNDADSYAYGWSAVVQERATDSGGGTCTFQDSPVLGGGCGVTPHAEPVLVMTTVSGSGKTFELNLHLDAIAALTLTTKDAATGVLVRKDFSRPCVSDTQPPEITVLRQPEGDTYVGNNLVVQVTDLVDPHPVVKVNNAAVMLDSNNRFVLTKPEADVGSEQVIIWASDSSRNTVTKTFSLRHDMRK